MKYKIYDWAGNSIVPDKTFDSFEDGWYYIEVDLTEMLGLVEEDYQEYHVQEVTYG